MDRLRLTTREVQESESALAEAIQALQSGQTARKAPPQLGQGKHPGGEADG